MKIAALSKINYLKFRSMYAFEIGFFRNLKK